MEVFGSVRIQAMSLLPRLQSLQRYQNSLFSIKAIERRVSHPRKDLIGEIPPGALFRPDLFAQSLTTGSFIAHTNNIRYNAGSVVRFTT